MTAVDTYLLLRAFCDELARCGMQHACTSPGSRSTPIVLSLVREPRIRCWSHIDERCAAFFALGAAKSSGLPAAVTCTSGTAAANLAPAVIEAHEARVPMLVLTADRPAELRQIGAGQAIDQLKLYGDAVKWFFEVGVDHASESALRWIRTLACRAYWTAATGSPGPVHLNFPLREPLVLDDQLPEDLTGRDDARPYVAVERSPKPRTCEVRQPSGKIVIVAGRDERLGIDAERLERFASQVRIPLLADPLSGARRGPAAIAHYDLLLRDRAFAQAHRPDLVIRVGEVPTSKPLRAWLGSLEAAQIAVDPDLTWHDPDARVGLRIATTCGALLDGVADGELIPSDPSWLASWRAADDTAERAIVEGLGESLSEPAVARGLVEWLPEEATLFVASSMPIRDVESFAPVRSGAPRTLANRGANGIDGTVSTAFGVASTSGRPVVLLIGDVALAHDIGGLLAARRLGLALTIVLLNNDGGGIFHFLPVSTQADAFEEHVATPHGLQFDAVAALYGLGYERPQGIADFRAAVARSVRSRAANIIEVSTDREQNLALHRRLAEAVLGALEASRRAPEAGPEA
jgi:2-succinyl-5-enolpyruvyl-6-hydroxy-3-cyclohexene-1-carboxylate synthase